MTTVGIICEYNPMHLGHIRHITETKLAVDSECAIICVMSGNFVQRGGLAVFSKHSRAEAAVLCGADLVIELPLPYALSSAEGFAHAGVYLLGKMGAQVISFGSESGDIGALCDAARIIASPEADMELVKHLGDGLSYAAARQKAAESLMPYPLSELLKTPNNLLGIEYIKAIERLQSNMHPLTIKREGGNHDSPEGCSASALRAALIGGEFPEQFMPGKAANVYMSELAAGRGPVSVRACETAILARLRNMSLEGFKTLPLTSGGLDRRFMRYAATEPTLKRIIEKTKTKRYAESRIRRLLFYACLGITAGDLVMSPPYIRPLAMNKTGIRLLREAANSGLPIITKPASARKLPEQAFRLFCKEAAATDLFVLAYPGEENRAGGQEWTISPRIIP